MMLLGWVNLIGLVILAVRHAAKGDYPRGEQPLLWMIFIWLSLILTGHALTVVRQLDNPYLYCGLSLLILWGLQRMFDRIARDTVPPRPVVAIAPLSFASFENPKTEKYLRYMLFGLLMLAAACSLALVLNNYAGNADSVSYRLPRTFWYVSHGSFLHPFEAFDRRTIFYPLNGVALYVPLVVYGAPGTFHNLPTYIAWLAVTLTCYRFARALGAARTIALLAAALAALTPDILVQAAATNDEILAGGALLLAVYFLFRWLQDGRKIYLLLCAAATGMGVGTKLHVVFYLPLLAIAVIMAAAGIWRNPRGAKALWRRIGAKTAMACAGLLGVTVLPFLIYNKISAGKFYFADEFAKDFFNLHAKLQVGLQNALIYLSQMTFAPIADLYGVPDGQDRADFHNRLNAFFKPLIEPLLSTDRTDYHLQYKFTGITLAVSPAYLEYSLWAGFMWLLAPLIWIQIARARGMPLRGWWLLLSLSPMLWFITWCASTLYMEGTPTYLAYYLIVAAPTLLFALLPVARPWLNRLRWLAILFVLLTHAVIDANVYLYNEFRNIPRLMESNRLPYDWELMEPGVIAEIEQAKNIRIVFTRWGLSYFGMMHHNPHAFYYGPHEKIPDPDTTLQILAAPGAERWGFAPVFVPHKPTPGLTFIGKMRGWGAEGVFVSGNGVERRHPDASRYLLFYAKATSENGRAALAVSETLPGLNSDDRLSFRYRWRRGDEGGKILAERDWDHAVGWTAQADGAGHDILEIEVRVPGASEPDAHYELHLSSLREWTDDFPSAGTP